MFLEKKEFFYKNVFSMFFLGKSLKKESSLIIYFLSVADDWSATFPY